MRCILSTLWIFLLYRLVAPFETPLWLISSRRQQGLSSSTTCTQTTKTTTTTTTTTSLSMSSSEGEEGEGMGDDAISPPSSTTTTSSVRMESSCRVLGICGGIGSGKSTAAKLLVSDCSCLVHLDADSLAHSVYQPGSPAVYDIISVFGSDILLETPTPTSSSSTTTSLPEIDRKKLGAIVFSNRMEMAKLERLVWPHVKTLVMEKIDQVKSEWQQEQQQEQQQESFRNPIMVLEAAVLLDAGWDDLLDGIWVVRASKNVALQRLMETRNLSQEEAMKRMSAQESRRGIGNLQEEIKNGIITKIIENNSNQIEDLKDTLREALFDPTSWKTTTTTTTTQSKE